MDLSLYQEEANRTRNKCSDELQNYMLGLIGEVGEFVNYIKKTIYHGHRLEMVKAREELGDILWYLAVLSTVLRIPFEDVAYYNVKKLKKRYPIGYSDEASIHRTV